MAAKSSTVESVVNTVMPAMSPVGTPASAREVTAESKIASASVLALAPSRTLSQSADGSTASSPPVTLVRTTQA